jgi:hypothetical protein
MNHHEQVEQLRHELTEALPGSLLSANELEAEAPMIVPEQFVIDDAQKASWVVRKVVEARAYAQRVEAWCERELRRAGREEAWLLRRFEPELVAWTRAELQRQSGRRRSLDLPGGTVGFRLQPPKVEIIDEQTLIGWCRSHMPIALKVTVEANDQQGIELLQWQRQHASSSRLRQQVLRDPLNHHVSETGEIPEGAAVRPAADQFYMR